MHNHTPQHLTRDDRTGALVIDPVRRALALAGAIVIALLAHASLAVASTYEVHVCGVGDGSAGTSSGLTISDSGGSRGYMNTLNFCSQGTPSLYAHAYVPNSSYSSWTWDGDGRWWLTAPANTTLEALTMTRTFQGFQSWFTWDLQTPDGNLLERAAVWGGGGGQPASGTRTYNVNATYVRGRFYCALSSCSGTGTSVKLTNLRARVSDTNAPTMTAQPSGSLLAGGQLRGMKGVSFSASDLGSGIYRAGLLVDGVDEQLTAVDANGGRCVKPFQHLVPCKLNVSSSFTIDTTQIPDGDHEVQVVAYDATGEGRAVSAPVTVTIHNAPESTGRPALAGTMGIGQQLSAIQGAWIGSPTSYAYQWLRCPASVTSPADADSCAVIPGATSSSYTLGTGDVYRRVMIRETATNASGSGSATSAPSDLVADAQGRTSPPPPSDGGSRDVVIVPVSPGSGSSTSTTTIINPPPGSSPIAGLTNPIAGPGHRPNGTNAGEGGRARIWLERRVRGRRVQVSVVRSPRAKRWAIKGRLLNAGGRPIGRGQLVAAWQINGRWEAHTGVTTRENGRFKYLLPKGPTRRIKFVYFAFSDSGTWSESNVVAVKVKTPVKLRVAPHAARNNGRAVEFTGSVAADFLPKGGVLVRLQGRAPGDRWKDVKTVRTRASGRFVVRYGFTNTRARTLYQFRAVVAKQVGYPFEGGISRTTTVLVTP